MVIVGCVNHTGPGMVARWDNFGHMPYIIYHLTTYRISINQSTTYRIPGTARWLNPEKKKQMRDPERVNGRPRKV